MDRTFVPSSAPRSVSIQLSAPRRSWLISPEMKLNHIPYKGSAQATTDLLGGQVMMSIPGTAGMVGHIKAGKLRALAVTGATRSPQLPDVPTVMESGVPGYEAYVWMGLLAPRGTPAPIVDKLQRAVVAVLALPEVKGYMATAGIEVVGSTPAEFGRFFRSEKELKSRSVRKSGESAAMPSSERSNRAGAGRLI